MTTPHKIAIAVACLVGVAALIAMDQWKLQKQDAPPAPPPAVEIVQKPVQQAVASPVSPAAAHATEAVICPAPETPVKPAVAPVAAPPAPERVYTVAQGDSLYGISVKVFGTPRHYERIYEANRDRIKDPNTLQVGINLKMPEVAAKPAQ